MFIVVAYALTILSRYDADRDLDNGDIWCNLATAAPYGYMRTLG